MIKITITKDLIYYTGIKSEGHATGPDKNIICAAVSSLIQTALQGIINILEVYGDKYDDNITIEHGLFEAHMPSDRFEFEMFKADIIIETIELGLITIAKQHENNISIVYEESGKNEKA